jgi:predicted transcriptional regulator
MISKLSDELREAIQQNPQQGVRLEDEQTQAVYVVVDEETHNRAMKALRQQEDLDAIQRGMDAAAEGRVSTLADVDARIREKVGLPPRR